MPLVPAGPAGLQVEATRILAAALPTSKLESLEMCENSIGDLGAQALAKVLPKTPLAYLGLMRNNIGDRGLADILLASRALPPNMPLRINMNASDYNQLIHGDTIQGWIVPENVPRPDHFLRSLIGIDGGKFAFVRWAVVVLFLFAFLLPRMIRSERGSRIVENYEKYDTIVAELEQLCREEEVAHMRGAFMDPYLALFIVVVAVAGARLVSGLNLALTGHITPRIRRLVSRRYPDLYLSLFTTLSDFNDVEGAPRPFDVRNSSDKVTRSFFLFLHALIVFFVMGDYFLWSPDDAPKKDSSALCRVSRVTVVVFYKPFLVSALCCFRFVTDSSGTLLWHNPLTDTIIAVLIALLFVWGAISFIFSFPLLVIFFFFSACFYAPAVVYLATVNLFEVAPGSRGKPGPVVESNRASLHVFKRLLGLSTFCVLVFGVSLWPFYEGEGYAHAVERVGASIAAGLRIWDPESWHLVFIWPRTVSPLSQAALALALAAAGFEAAQALWSALLYRAYPFGWDLGPHAMKNYGDEIDDSKQLDQQQPASGAPSEVNLDFVTSDQRPGILPTTPPASKHRRQTIKNVPGTDV